MRPGKHYSPVPAPSTDRAATTPVSEDGTACLGHRLGADRDWRTDRNGMGVPAILVPREDQLFSAKVLVVRLKGQVWSRPPCADCGHESGSTTAETVRQLRPRVGVVSASAAHREGTLDSDQVMSGAPRPCGREEPEPQTRTPPPVSQPAICGALDPPGRSATARSNGPGAGRAYGAARAPVGSVRVWVPHRLVMDESPESRPPAQLDEESKGPPRRTRSRSSQFGRQRTEGSVRSGHVPPPMLPRPRRPPAPAQLL